MVYFLKSLYDQMISFFTVCVYVYTKVVIFLLSFFFFGDLRGFFFNAALEH